jgi:hemerythrin superfamily protein
MNTKLTLTIERSVIENAKKYAKNKKRSLSDLIESYLKTLTRDTSQEAIELTPKVKSLKGSFRLPDTFDYQEELTDVLSKKYMNE